MKNKISGFVICFFTSINVFATNPMTAVVDSLQTNWNQTQNYKAEFKQVVYSKKLHTKDETTGTIFVLKPGKIRWEVPSQKTVQILNGNRLIYIKDNRRRKTTVVDIYKDVSKSIDLKSLAFLAGNALFKETYTSVLGAEGPETVELKLISKAAPSESYLAEIDKKSYFLRALTTETADSKVRIDFLKTETNIQMGQNLFEYQPKPKDVVHENP